MLEMIGAWRDDWTVPGCDPVDYLDRLGVIDERTLVVHGVQFGDDALATTGANRRHARHLSAQQPVGWCRISAD